MSGIWASIFSGYSGISSHGTLALLYCPCLDCVLTYSQPSFVVGSAKEKVLWPYLRNRPLHTDTLFTQWPEKYTDHLARAYTCISYDWHVWRHYLNKYSIWKTLQLSHNISPVLWFLGWPYLDARNLRTVYAIAILTSLLHRVHSALQCGTNISTSEKFAELSVFSGIVTYIYSIKDNGFSRSIISTQTRVLRPCVKSIKAYIGNQSNWHQFSVRAMC